MLSTILFIEDQPVGYTVLVEKDECYFSPSEYSTATVAAPSFRMKRNNDSWEVYGLTDEKLFDQLQAALPLVTKDHTNLSVAP